VDGSPSGVAFYGSNGLSLFMDGGNSYQIRDTKGKVVKDAKSQLTFAEGDRFNPSGKLDSFHFQNWLDASSPVGTWSSRSLWQEDRERTLASATKM
jgi:hypothetical protein